MLVMNKLLAPCKNCGKDWNQGWELIDTLYPCNRELTKWNIVCQIHNGGCNRTVYGKSRQDVIDRWNNDQTDII
jgi:hypothetical protein